MQEYIAKFEKVSFEQYLKDRMFIDAVSEENENFETSYKNEVFEDWKNIKLPKRSTSGAAGYDFYMPHTSAVGPKSIMVPTGIRVKMNESWVFMLFPRSGLGTKYKTALDNTVGIIDSDYYYSDNEGHIMAKIHSETPFCIHQDERFIQGVFVPYGVAENGNTDTIRSGGLGSTGTK